MPIVSRQKVSKSTAKSPATKKGVRPPKITKISKDGEAPVKMSLYGRSGTGKTVIWSTFPGPILVLVCSSIKKPGEWHSISLKHRDKISKWEIESYEEVHQAIEFAKSSDEFKTIVLDHATGMHDLNLKEETGMDELPVQRDWGVISREQYSAAGSRTKEILREFLGLDYQNIIVVSQERQHKQGDDSDEPYSDLDIVPNISTDLPKAVSGWFNQSCNYVVRAFVQQKTGTKKIAGKSQTIKLKGQVDFCLMVGPHPAYWTKFRKPPEILLPESIKNPSYQKIMKLVRGEE